MYVLFVQKLLQSINGSILGGYFWQVHEKVAQWSEKHETLLQNYNCNCNYCLAKNISINIKIGGMIQKENSHADVRI